jgi:hypothetical protein
MSNFQIPPHTFDALYRYYRHRIPAGSFLAAVIRNDGLDAARRADSENLKALGDIILFNDWAKNYNNTCIANGDFMGVDLKWETWRMRFSPEASEINFDRGDDNDD